MTTVRDVLVKARGLIGSPERWAKGARARNSGGAERTPLSGDAVRWCAYGAIERAAAYDAAATALVVKAGDELRKTRVAFSVWQDRPSRTHAEVLAAFDEAIARCAQ